MEAIGKNEGDAAEIRTKTKAFFESVRKVDSDSGENSFFIRRIIRTGKRISVFQDEKFGHIERLKPAEFLAIRRESAMGFSPNLLRVGFSDEGIETESKVECARMSSNGLGPCVRLIRLVCPVRLVRHVRRVRDDRRGRSGCGGALRAPFFEPPLPSPRFPVRCAVPFRRRVDPC